jgi:hypothetical protein
MLRYFKFHQSLFDPVPASEIYHKPGPGRGWPEECPPIRAAQGFGFDLLANFDLTFVRSRPTAKSPCPWKLVNDLVVESDFDYVPPGGEAEESGSRLSQQYAWFWQKGQTVPHPISDNVYEHVKHQVKVSTFLYIKTDPNELLWLGELPNHRGPYRVMSALADTDWFAASYPWHTVLELSPHEKRITIKKGTPLCRAMVLRRDTYFAAPMRPQEFSDFFDKSQEWLSTHGKPTPDPATRDITRTYVRQQLRSKFVVVP